MATESFPSHVPRVVADCQRLHDEEDERKFVADEQSFAIGDGPAPDLIVVRDRCHPDAEIVAESRLIGPLYHLDPLSIRDILERQIDGDERTRTSLKDRPANVAGTIVGSVAYMSRVQGEGRAIDARSDIFSSVCVRYEMLTGRRAFPFARFELHPLASEEGVNLMIEGLSD